MNPPLHSLAFVTRNVYKDSVALMRVAQRLLALPGVVNATLQMGTAANKEILHEAGLLNDELAGAGPGDIMVAVQAGTRAACDAALAECRKQLDGRSAELTSGGAVEAVAARTLAMGQAALAGANIAQISVPGAYAGAEALKALQLGLNVFMFSDNVPLDQEVALKREAVRRGLLVMGPDCGTAIIGGVPLGFANNVRRGPIGLVAASGTGLQEVTTQIHRMGGGISHAVGTGGRDVHARVGAATLLQGIELLGADPQTRVIVVLCKPPAPELTAKVIAALRAAAKPAVVLFLGSDFQPPAQAGAPIRVTRTLVDCAAAAVTLAGLQRPRTQRGTVPMHPAFQAGQTDLRALYSGGTFAAEAQVIWAQAGLSVRSNVAIDKTLMLDHPRQVNSGHVALDLGDDAFTVGRPHPMIDQAARVERLLLEAADQRVRVIVLDVVIGWGAHPDPAGELAPAITQAKRMAAQAGRELAVIGFVCGTELDPQGLARQQSTLRDAGVVLADNSANAAWLAGQWVQ